MTGSTLIAVCGAFAAACITESVAGVARADAAGPTVPLGRLQVLGCRDRDRAGLGRDDIRLAHVAHEDPAACDLIGADVAERRLLDLAAVDDERTPRVELAPRRRVGKVGRKPLDADQPVLAR